LAVASIVLALQLSQACHFCGISLRSVPRILQNISQNQAIEYFVFERG